MEYNELLSQQDRPCVSNVEPLHHYYDSKCMRML